MNCYYHPDREPVGSCVNCGQLICAECKVVLGGKVYCNPCANKLVTKIAHKNRPKGLNWFERHLNWTLVLTWLAIFPIGFIVGFIMFMFYPYISDESIGGLSVIVGLTWILLTNGWVIKKKRRSLWWLLVVFIPFIWGLIILLCLKNRSQLKRQQNRLHNFRAD